MCVCVCVVESRWCRLIGHNHTKTDPMKLTSAFRAFRVVVAVVSTNNLISFRLDKLIQLMSRALSAGTSCHILLANGEEKVEGCISELKKPCSANFHLGRTCFIAQK